MSMTTTTRIQNFSAGPAILPLEVLEEAQQNLVSLPGVGMSILEVSHRSKVFEGVLARAEADIRQLEEIRDLTQASNGDEPFAPQVDLGLRMSREIRGWLREQIAATGA